VTACGGNAGSHWDPGTDWAAVEAGECDSAICAYSQALASGTVSRVDRAFGGFWGILRYDGVVAAALNTHAFSNVVPLFGARRPPLESDPPEHTAYRRSLNPFFHPGRLLELEPVIRRYARELLCALPGNEPSDFVDGFSDVLPTRALCALMRVSDDHWRSINAWTREVDRAGGQSAPGDDSRNRAAASIMPFLMDLISARRSAPRDDIVTALTRLHVGDSTLDDQEIASLLLLLVSAGHNTTASAIANLVLRMARSPELQRHVREHPEDIPDAIEESLRLDSPQQGMRRVARCPVTVGDVSVGAGENVWLLFGAANLDPARWDDPGQFRLHRPSRRHLAFGHGVHQCLGAPLARLEVRIATEELIAATEWFDLGGAVRRPTWPRLGVTELPLRITFAYAAGGLST
jgi:cytochrome P450